MAEALADNILTPLSILPGRIRWQVAGLRSNVPGAALFEGLLAASDWIQSAVVNVVTGRVLVHFDPELPPEIIAGTVREAAQSSVACDEDALPEESESDRYRQVVESVGANSIMMGFSAARSLRERRCPAGLRG